MKRKHAMFKKDQKDKEEYNNEFAEAVFKELCEESRKRRVIVREESGEIKAELPLPAGIAIVIILSIFMFPLVIIALIAGYRNKMQIEVIRDISEDEEILLDTLEQQNTLYGIQYEPGDGQATLLQ